MNPYADRIQDARDRAPNEFIRQILEDGLVTEAEYADMRQRVVDCVRDSGSSIVTYYEQDEYGRWSLAQEYWGEPSAVDLQISGDCSHEWTGVAESLYWDMRSNPNNEDWDDLVAQCLVRHGLVPKGFTGEDYVQLQDEYSALFMELVPGSWEEIVSPDGTGTHYSFIPDDPFNLPEIPPMALPGGHNMEEPEVRACVSVPLR
ncbi:MAG: hypothetical protein LBH11_06935 [Propionibacteriaceae bacterium]|nr:hypothetical protein [Propionibacteriaceae bacterium]